MTREETRVTTTMTESMIHPDNFPPPKPGTLNCNQNVTFLQYRNRENDAGDDVRHDERYEMNMDRKYVK